MSLLERLREKHCPRCHRVACICKEITRGEVEAAAEKGRDPRPYPCPRCRRTVRAGVCPGPDC